MTKMISLLSAQYVGGLLRHPEDGALPASDAEAKRLVDDEKVAIDVTADFDGMDGAPHEDAPSDPAAPADGDDHKPARRKAPASKE